jgi:uncharacterized membrane protein (DUF2068 family)
MVDWSTLACGQGGHMTFAPDEPELAAQMRATLSDGPAWQCLRCGSFVAGEPALSGPAATAPIVARGREVRSRLILRLFAVERFLRAIVIAAAAVGLWQFRHSQSSIEKSFDRELPAVRGLFRQLGYNINNSKLVGLLHHALTLSSKTLTLLAIGLALYAIIELVEGTGLWLSRRWGEYFAMVATSLGLPLEIYDLTRNVTVLALVVFGVNLALVLYLVITKRLFGVRGGKAAYDARLRSESVLEAAEKAAASRRRPAPSQPAGTQPAGTQTASTQASAAENGATVTTATGTTATGATATGSGLPRSEPTATAAADSEDRPPGAEPVGKASDGLVSNFGQTAANNSDFNA